MLKDHFYFRLALNILVGAMYVYALYNMARHTTLKEQPSKKFFTRILGWFFITLGVITSIASISFMFHIPYPVETQSGYDAIIHTSSAYLYWGYPTAKQASVLTTLLNSFLLLGVGSYSLAYKKTDNSLWKKVTQFGLGFLLSIAMYSASNFHYFDWPEFIAPSLFLSIWCFILIKYKKNDNKNRQDIFCGITEKEILPCTSLTQEKSMAIFKSETKKIVDKEDPEKIGKDSTETDIQHCKHCGKKIEPDSIFCKYCGRKVSQSIGFTCFLQHSKQFCKNIVTRRLLFFLGIILVLVIFGICMYNAYITEIRPKHKAEEILFREREELSKLDGDDLIWKCHNITLGVSRTGNESYDEYVRQVLTERAKEVLDSLEMEAQNDNPTAQYAFACYYLRHPNLLRPEGEGWFAQKKFKENRDAARGAYWYLRAAMNNHAWAQYHIGVCFEIGHGVQKDIRQAINWYQKSAINGIAEGQLKMGDWFRDGYKQKIGEHWEKDPNKIIDSYEIIVQRNLDSAFVYWKKAAEQGSLDAKKRLEQIYPAEL